jgi:hypothetical protein
MIELIGYRKNKIIMKAAVILLCAFMFSSCSSKLSYEEAKGKKDGIGKNTTEPLQQEKKEEQPVQLSLINETGSTIAERFRVPEGFERIAAKENSFADYLRNLKLKPHGSKVLYYDGREKNRSGVYEAVVDISIGDRDLHQCADAVMLLRGEYLFKQKRYNEIHFNFVNGFRTEYSKWMQGYRIKVTGNNAVWIKSREHSNSYEEFRRYMDMVFAYASTLSLEKEMKPVKKEELKIGDIFIKGPDPGHTVIVVDMAENKQTGEKLFMIAQSYMPAQETQVLCNSENQAMSPWYSLNFSDKLYTPEWTFDETQIRRFKNE